MIFKFSFPDIKDKEEIITGFYREMHIIDDLKANVLIRLNITRLKGFVLDLYKYIITI